MSDIPPAHHPPPPPLCHAAPGFISEQQFRDIVDAEQLNSKSEVAKLWRHPHLHPHQHIKTTPW